MINSPDPISLTDIRNLDLATTMRPGRVLAAGAGVSGRGVIAMPRDIGCPKAIIMDDSALDALVTADFPVRHVMTADARGELADIAAVVTSPG